MIKYYCFVINDLNTRYEIIKTLKIYHISIKEVADQCDCTPVYIYNMLKGYRPVSYNFNEFLRSIGINLSDCLLNDVNRKTIYKV